MAHNFNFLAHFGILGQKWGIRRFQNKDGTLTSEGKKRYYRERDVRSDVDKAFFEHREAVSRIKANAPLLTKAGEELSEKYSKAFLNKKFTNDQKEKIWDELHKEFGNHISGQDEDIFNMAVEEYAEEHMINSLPKSVIDARKKFDKQMSDYFDDVHQVTKDLIDKYKNAEIVDVPSSNRFGDSMINQIVSNEFDTKFIAYMGRHYDDYWVHSASYYEGLQNAIKDFTLSEYNKRYEP